MTFRPMTEVTGFEVHARIKKGKTVFRIWNGMLNKYETGMLSEENCVRHLVALETKYQEVGGKKTVKRIVKEVVKRVANAKEDGFESPFVTSGELHDPWKTEGKRIVRGI